MNDDELHVYFADDPDEDSPLIIGARDAAYAHGGIVIFENSKGDALVSTLFPWHRIDRVERRST